MSSDSASQSRRESVIRTHLSGRDLLMNPRLNKGTAFSEEERDTFALHGLLPPHIGTLESQRERRKRVLDSRPTAFGKYSNMRDLQDNNETLFYSLIAHNIEELLPIVYTPAVGEGCQRFSEIWRKPRGLFLSYPNKERIEQILANPQLRFRALHRCQRRRAHPRPRRSGRGRHGHPHRENGALHRAGRHSAGTLPARAARCGYRQRNAAP